MAKYITYIVLLANVILGLWVYSQPKEPTIDEKIKAIPEDKRLILLSELQAPEQTPAEEDELAIPEIEVTQAENNGESSQQSQEESIENVISEQEPEEPIEPIISKVCYTIGPFLTGADANRVGKLMQDNKLDVSRREKTEKQVYGYRVFIPPLPTRQEASAVTRELSDLGILDYYIITEDEQANGISLGLFKQKTGAIRRMAQIRRFNFGVKMEARHRETIVYWLDVSDEQQAFTRPLWSEISETASQLQRLTKKC